MQKWQPLRHASAAREGSALITVLMVVAVLSILGPALLTITLADYEQSLRATKNRQAYNSAAGGVEVALADIRTSPQTTLVNGKTWTPDATAPAGLDFVTTLTTGAQPDTYSLTSRGGPAAQQHVITMTITATTGTTDSLAPYAIAMGTNLNLGSNNDLSAGNGPTFIDGNLAINVKNDGSYALTNGYPVTVSGTATYHSQGPVRSALASDLGASTLTVGSAPTRVNPTIDSILAAALSPGIPGAVPYAATDWSTYQTPAKRLVYQAGPLSLNSLGAVTAYGRYVVGGTLTVQGGTSLVIYGALDVKGLNIAKGSSVQVLYQPDLVPAAPQTLTVSSWQVTH